MAIQEVDIVRIQDMGLAVALLCKKFELIDLRQEVGGRMAFCFKQDAELANAITAYWNGHLQVSAKDYWAESKNLKTRLYGVLNNGR